MEEYQIYTVQDVAHILHVCTKTVYQIIRDGDLEVIRVRGQIRVTSTALRTYTEGGKQ